jgi:hypothetical protein
MTGKSKKGIGHEQIVPDKLCGRPGRVIEKPTQSADMVIIGIEPVTTYTLYRLKQLDNHALLRPDRLILPRSVKAPELILERFPLGCSGYAAAGLILEMAAQQTGNCGIFTGGCNNRAPAVTLTVNSQGVCLYDLQWKKREKQQNNDCHLSVTG